MDNSDHALGCDCDECEQEAYQNELDQQEAEDDLFMEIYYD